VFISPAYSQHTSDSKSKQSDLSDTNSSKDNDIVGTKPKRKILRSGKPLEPSVPSIEVDSSHVKMPRIDITIPATPIRTVPIQSIAPSIKVTDEIKKHFKFSPAEICRQKLKSIIIRTINGQDKLPIGVCEPRTKS